MSKWLGVLPFYLCIPIQVPEFQHHAYEECLAALGCEVQRLPAEADLPDSVFVEDTALVLDEVAVILQAAAASPGA